MRDETDQSLIDRAVAGDTAAFARLVERHYDFIYRVAWRWLGDQTDAEDLAQDVCVGLARAISGFRGDAAFTSWLYRVVLNRVRDVQRARKRRSDSATVLAFEAVDAEPDTGPEDAAAASDLWRAVRKLPDKQRDATLLVYAEDRSHAEAAEVMGCAENTVSWHLHEARKSLKVMFEGQAHE